MREIDTKAFKKAMIDADYNTYGELSDDTGINRNTLSDIASGEQNPSYETMCKLADALFMTYEQIGSIFFHIDLATLKGN